MIDLEAIRARNETTYSAEHEATRPQVVPRRELLRMVHADIDILLAEVERLNGIFECVHCSAVRHDGHLCEQHELEAALA